VAVVGPFESIVLTY